LEVVMGQVVVLEEAVRLATRAEAAVVRLAIDVAATAVVAAAPSKARLLAYHQILALEANADQQQVGEDVFLVEAEEDHPCSHSSCLDPYHL
jgi:hypothetical protein